jgi:16S rRNA (adenine1518-N6/adenine1519-N6)-dimethyltransferase
MQHNLGQHFLTNPAIARSIATYLPTQNAVVTLEIGPGEGALTAELLAAGHRVLAVEKDTALIPHLTQRFAAALTTGQLTLLHEDIRNIGAVMHALSRISHNSMSKKSIHRHLATSTPATSYQIIANIPYYITGQIIRQFLTATEQPIAMALLIQKEVAERIIARNGKQSLLSLAVAAYGTPHMVRTVKAGSFSPPPKVDSAVLTITNITRKHFATPAHEQHFFEILHAAFGEKRKMLRSTLKHIYTEAALKACDIPPTSRPEDVSFAQWLCLARTTLLE